MIRRLITGLTIALTACSACRAQPPPTVPTTAASIAAELVDAGCIVSSTTLAASIQAEEESDAAPSWLRCLIDGGSPRTCNIPCGDGNSP